MGNYWMDCRRTGYQFYILLGCCRSNKSRSIEERLHIANEELSHADEFDHAVVNDDLARAIFETKQLIKDEIEG